MADSNIAHRKKFDIYNEAESKSGWFGAFLTFPLIEDIRQTFFLSHPKRGGCGRGTAERRWICSRRGSSRWLVFGFGTSGRERKREVSGYGKLRNYKIFTDRFWNQICTALSAMPILLLSSRRSVEVGERSLLNAASSWTSCSGVTRLRLRRSLSSFGALRLMTVSRAAFDLSVRWAPDEGSTEGGSLRGGVCLSAGAPGESVSENCWGGDEELDGSSGCGWVGDERG
jgi:hypothetical protein